ncbi:MAG: DNA topoisomerase I [Candidatus Thorarchaeota archaeon]|nr:DNA topoisomerase I [Candidatus Thorarchaeota archaeon]
MIISEKPTAAKRIAEALSQQGSLGEVKKGRVSYYEFKRGKDTLVVAYALGHLYDLRQTEKGWTYPRLETEWVPKYEVVKKATGIKPIIKLIKRLAKEADEFVVATDFDIEGSLIGYLTVKYACGTDPANAKRMIFSSLTAKDLESAYENMSPMLEFPLIEAGKVRHEVDWLYGVNLTRALTLAIKSTAGWFKIVSTGRVQGPTLAFVAKREQDINLFVPVPFWTIKAVGDHEGAKIELEYSRKRIDIKKEADAIGSELQEKQAHVDSVEKKKSTHRPPIPFNLSGLQAESYRHFGFKPSRTLVLAQKLYLDALISYPRTSSQKIPASVDVKEILHELSGFKQYGALAKRVLDAGMLTPVQGKKDDPAHPAIHPTGVKPPRRLTPSEKKVFDLIVRRFLALFGEPSVKESRRADVRCNNYLFHVRGLRVLKQGWMEYYQPYATANEKEFPPIKQGDLIQLTSVHVTDKQTSPVPRYNPSSLLKALERENLGTKSTRSRIADSIRSRGYVLNDRFELSTLGYALFETLEQYVPEMLSVELTLHLEKQMEGIQDGDTDREQVLVDAKRELLKILERFRAMETAIGNTLVSGLQRYWKEKQEIGPCPTCDVGTLSIITSSKTGKRFLGCSNYKEGRCEQTYSLPQRGEISPLDKMCPHCGHKMIKITSRRRAWETCINWAKCPGRREDLEELEKRRRSHAKRKMGGKSK